MLRAVLFDFDGLILDTEMPEVQSYREIYRDHGREFPDEIWMTMIGISSVEMADLPWKFLEREVGPLDWDQLREQSRTRRLELIAQEPPRPGVIESLDACRDLGFRLAVVSSSRRSWVEGHLQRLGLLERFEGCVCGHEGLPSKPSPDLYKRALLNMELLPEEVLAVEDSPNGIAAATGAGLYTLAVPNDLTAQLDLSGAHRQVSSLREVDWAALSLLF